MFVISKKNFLQGMDCKVYSQDYGFVLCIPSLDRSYPNLLLPAANANRKLYTDNLGVFLGLLALPALCSLEGGSSIFRLIEVQIE
jgi:hypothetical protein